MKKLVLGMCLTLIAFSSYSQLITLNGVDKGTAKQMVADFNTYNNRKPTPTSIWFDSGLIHRIVLLLKSEIVSGRKVDGIRIYYCRNAGQNSVLLVSTDDNGPSTTSLSKRKHKDDFNQDIRQLLPTAQSPSSSINGAICNDNSCGGTKVEEGARLYTINQNCNEDKNCDCSEPHYITMSYAEEMVWNFGNALVNSKSEWFDLGLFESIDKLYASNDPTIYDGIRIYFGKHSVIDPILPGRDAFVIVTTKTVGGVHTDFFDCDITKNFFKKFKDSAKNNKNGEDRGEQCEPDCDGAEL